VSVWDLGMALPKGRWFSDRSFVKKFTNFLKIVSEQKIIAEIAPFV
jgi:hypothetical protein